MHSTRELKGAVQCSEHVDSVTGSRVSEKDGKIRPVLVLIVDMGNVRENDVVNLP